MQILGYTGNDDARKFVLNEEVTLEKIKVHLCASFYLYIMFISSSMFFFLLVFLLNIMEKT